MVKLVKDNESLYPDHYNDPISSFIQEKLRCDEDGRTSHIEDRLKKLEASFGQLVELLVNKGVLQDEDIFSIVDEFGDRYVIIEKD